MLQVISIAAFITGALSVGSMSAQTKKTLLIGTVVFPEAEHGEWLKVQADASLGDAEKVRKTVDTFFDLKYKSWIKLALLDFGFLFDRQTASGEEYYAYERGLHYLWMIAWREFHTPPNSIESFKYEPNYYQFSVETENARVKVFPKTSIVRSFPKGRADDGSFALHDFTLILKGGQWLIESVVCVDEMRKIYPHGTDFDEVIRKDRRYFQSEETKMAANPAMERHFIQKKKLQDDQTMVWLAKAMDDRSWEIRLAAVDDLKKIGGPEAIRLLAKALEDADTNVRVGAVKALGAIGGPVVLEKMAALSEKKDYALRVNAIAVMALIKSPDALGPLTRAVGDKNPLVRESAVKALVHIDDSRATAPIVGALGDRNANVRAAAAVALGLRREAAAVEPLAALLREESRRIRTDAAVALGRLSDRRATPVLIEILADPKEQDDRLPAVEALGIIGDPRAVESLTRCGQEDNPRIRAAAAKALGRMGDPRAVPPLLELLRDKEPLVRLEAVLAFKTVKDHRAVEPLIELLDTEGPAIRYAVSQALQAITGEAFGPDYGKWKSWRAGRRSSSAPGYSPRPAPFRPA